MSASSHPQPSYQLTVDGRDITATVDPRLVSLSLTECRGGEADQLDLVLSDADGMLALPPKDALITVKLGWVYPVWDVDFEKNLSVLLEYERSIENLIMNGRPGLFFYNNLHHSLDMGFVAADHILSGLPKSKKWDIDTKKFEEFHLVE